MSKSPSPASDSPSLESSLFLPSRTDLREETLDESSDSSTGCVAAGLDFELPDFAAVCGLEPAQKINVSARQDLIKIWYFIRTSLGVCVRWGQNQY